MKRDEPRSVRALAAAIVAMLVGSIVAYNVRSHFENRARLEAHFERSLQEQVRDVRALLDEHRSHAFDLAVALSQLPDVRGALASSSDLDARRQLTAVTTPLLRASSPRAGPRPLPPTGRPQPAPHVERHRRRPTGRAAAFAPPGRDDR